MPMDTRNNLNMMQTVPHLDCIEISGADAAGFLDAQLSVNVSDLENSARRLACWCNAKGQVIATFLVIRHTPQAYRLILSTSLTGVVLKRMPMYVLRSQVDINAAPELQVTAPQRLRNDPLWKQLECVNDTGNLTSDGGDNLPAHDIEDGICWLAPETSEQFLPQMLAMEHLGALDYQKGCYPGQEIIARTHYLGRVKRRLWRIQVNTPAAHLQATPGAPIVDTQGGIHGQLVTSADTGSCTIGLAVLRDNHIDTVLSYETNGTQQTVSASHAIGTT